MCIRWLLTRRARWTVWLVPLGWLGFEFAHEFNTPAPYPWLPLGTSIVEFGPFVQTADIWGQYGLSAGLAFTALGVASLVQLKGEKGKLAIARKPFRRYVVPGAALLFVIASCVYGVVRVNQITSEQTDDGPLVAGVQGNLAQEVKVKRDPNRLPNAYKAQMDLSKLAVEKDAELVCWAETMVFYGATREGYSRGNSAESAEFFKDGKPDPGLLDGTAITAKGSRHPVSFIENLRARTAFELKTPMLVGTLTDIPDSERDVPWKMKTYNLRKYNTAMLIDPDGSIGGSYDKRYLVPGGEYIPIEEMPLIRKVIVDYAEGLQGYASRVEPGRRLTLFRIPSKAERLKGRDWAFTSSICYEYAWPSCYKELHEKPDRYPDFHVNISNEGWFRKSAELDQAVDYCRLRSIESRVPMLRATNTGITCSIDATGKVDDVLTVDGQDREVQGVLLMRPKVLLNPQPTIFVSMVGRGLGWLSLIVILCIMPAMLVGRVLMFVRRRRAKVAEKRITTKVPK
jgi:apolipoprotein N-acyltransferase